MFWSSSSDWFIPYMEIGEGFFEKVKKELISNSIHEFMSVGGGTMKSIYISFPKDQQTYQKRKDNVSCKALISGTEASVHCKLFVCSSLTTKQHKQLNQISRILLTHTNEPNSWKFKCPPRLALKTCRQVNNFWCIYMHTYIHIISQQPNEEID